MTIAARGVCLCRGVIQPLRLQLRDERGLVHQGSRTMAWRGLFCRLGKFLGDPIHGHSPSRCLVLAVFE